MDQNPGGCDGRTGILVSAEKSPIFSLPGLGRAEESDPSEAPPPEAQEHPHALGLMTAADPPVTQLARM